MKINIVRTYKWGNRDSALIFYHGYIMVKIYGLIFNILWSRKKFKEEGIRMVNMGYSKDLAAFPFSKNYIFK